MRRTISENDWRQRVRRRKKTSKSSWLEPSHLLFEMRFGPYSPQVDDEFGGSATPYADFFGSDELVYFGLELDWMPLHIPYVGSLGAAFGWGYTRASGKTKTSEGADAGSDTALNIFPMHVSAVFRLDGPLRQFGFPVAPYVKAGFGFGPWSTTGASGDSVATGPNGATVAGEGTSTGFHLAIGGALALNAFDRTSAIAMREETGIRYAYLWGEWMQTNLGKGSANQMMVGTSTAVFGLAIDF